MKQRFLKYSITLLQKINAYYIKHNLSSELAEELTQEVLSTIWIKAELFNSEKSKFITWSFTIARNKKIDFYRKNQKKFPMRMLEIFYMKMINLMITK